MALGEVVARLEVGDAGRGLAVGGRGRQVHGLLPAGQRRALVVRLLAGLDRRHGPRRPAARQPGRRPPRRGRRDARQAELRAVQRRLVCTHPDQLLAERLRGLRLRPRSPPLPMPADGRDHAAAGGDVQGDKEDGRQGARQRCLQQVPWAWAGRRRPVRGHGLPPDDGARGVRVVQGGVQHEAAEGGADDGPRLRVLAAGDDDTVPQGKPSV
mmetsp:Transcript_77441/g.205616  ORF Transcript_77441/g.205616 Transcript_77441/m.205616 type:complete len:212 (+) Transcript_77441:669-1304(+)